MPKNNKSKHQSKSIPKPGQKNHGKLTGISSLFNHALCFRRGDARMARVTFGQDDRIHPTWCIWGNWAIRGEGGGNREIAVEMHQGFSILHRKLTWLSRKFHHFSTFNKKWSIDSFISSVGFSSVFGEDFEGQGGRFRGWVFTGWLTCAIRV